MKQVIGVHDIRGYVVELNSSYARKRELYTEFQNLQISKGYNYSKLEYVREKFPRFPLSIRKLIATQI